MRSKITGKMEVQNWVKEHIPLSFDMEMDGRGKRK